MDGKENQPVNRVSIARLEWSQDGSAELHWACRDCNTDNITGTTFAADANGRLGPAQCFLCGTCYIIAPTIELFRSGKPPMA